MQEEGIVMWSGWEVGNAGRGYSHVVRLGGIDNAGVLMMYHAGVCHNNVCAG